MTKNFPPRKSGFKPNKFSGKPGAPKKKKESSGGLPVKGRLLYGTHACIEALKNPDRTVHKIYVTQKLWDGLLKDILTGIDHPAPDFIEKDFLDNKLPNGVVHQGIALDVAPEEEVFLQDIIIKAKTQERCLIIMLDQVTDPHNVGAILRSAAAFGAACVVGQSRHMPDMTPVIAKIASGAAEYVPIVREKNLSDSLETLKAEGFACIGLDERGEKSLAELPKSAKTVIVLGAEGKGLRPRVADTCTALAKLPTRPPIASLNVSNAAAIALYEMAGSDA